MTPVYAALAIGIAALVAIVWILIRIATRPGPTRSPKPTSKFKRVEARSEVMAGGLAHMALADLLQFLAQGAHTGTLQITSGRRTGIIRLVQGLVIHAEFRREQDLAAIFELLALRIGDFRFRFEPPPAEPVRGREVVDILMLSLARKDDQK